MNQILLSICIPTYNRCEVLDNTLNSLFSNPEFDSNKIEVIISDNCSDDDTQVTVGKYPLAKYYRNKENVKDGIFLNIALEYANGHYIKLFNDTVSFKPGALGSMINHIEENLGSGNNLFFYQNMFLNKNRKIIINDEVSYLKEVSFLSTWIVNFGIWIDDFNKIEDKNRYSKLLFPQVDWSYKTVQNKKNTVIYFDDYYDVYTPNKKGGYPFFDTFINNYLYIIKQQDFSLINYEIEKFRLCNRFVFKWLNILFIKEKSKYNFDTSGTFKIILKRYWYEPYLYFLFLWFSIKRVVKYKKGSN
ncbi:WcaA Glycosyltransferases involved in cell wall biogenesis [Flavobacteriaceae bacterium]